MPYIDVPSRKHFEKTVDFNDMIITEGGSMTPGELNYIITNICQSYIRRKGLSYTTLNELVGILECVKQEFYRREVVPYEDKKIKENGDVY